MHTNGNEAFPLCRNRQEQVACVGEAMRRLGEGCTSNDLKNSLGITQAELDAIVDDARAYAVSRSVVRRRVSSAVHRAA